MRVFAENIKTGGKFAVTKMLKHGKALYFQVQRLETGTYSRKFDTLGEARKHRKELEAGKKQFSKI